MTPRTPDTRICLWYNHDALEAAEFYARTFPRSSVSAPRTASTDNPAGKAGDTLVVEFTVLGLACIGLNGGPEFPQSEAFSFQVATADQTETDRYWNAIVSNGGQESACGWCKDKWGVSWQITPTVLIDALSDPDAAVRTRVFAAMMDMKKIDIAAINDARAGNTQSAATGRLRTLSSYRRTRSSFPASALDLSLASVPAP